MKYKMAVLFLTLALVFTGCAMKRAPESAPSSAPVEEGRMYDEATGGAAHRLTASDSSAWAGETQAKMIVYTAEMSLVVKDSDVAQEDITKMVEGIGGYISNSSS